MNYNFSLSNGSDGCGDVAYHCNVRRLPLQCTSPLPTALPRLPKKKGTIKGLRPSQYTPFIGVPIFFLLTNSMNYKFSLSNGSDSHLYNHTGDIIHVLTHDGRGIRTRTDVATSPSIAMYVVLTYAASVRVRIPHPP